MSPYYGRTTYSSIGYPRWTRGVKTLVLACVITFGVQLIAGSSFIDHFGLTPADVLYSGHIWQLATYIFLHDTHNILHILFNMLGLWMFGSELEQLWGTRQFTKFFFICGIGAGILMVLLYFLSGGDSRVTTIGASGSIYGILLAFGVLFPDRIIYYIIFPIPAKYFVMIMGGISLLMSLSSTTGGGVAHTTHLGGLAAGYFYLKKKPRINLKAEIQYRFVKWRINRMRRKFDVYSGGRRDDVDRRVH